MKRHNKLLVFIVAAAMIFSGISFNVVTFAANPNQYSIKTTDSTGNNVNDNFYDTKQDVYVRIDGEEFEYWVFVVSPNGTMLGSGGPFNSGLVFNLYDATGFDDTDNPGGSYNVWVGLVNEFDHSKMKNDHFKVKGSEPEDSLGEIDVTKIVVDHDDEVITDDDTQFKFRLYFWDKNKWEEVEDESPFYITGNDTVTIDGLPLGKYKVVEEDIPDGFELDSANDVEVTLDQNNLERKAEFTNKMDDDTPPPQDKGSLKVHKRIMRTSGSIDANLGDGEFTVKLTGPNDYEETKVIQKPGEYVTFDNLPFGTYTLEEIEAYDPELEFSDYFFANSGNQNYEVISDEVVIDSKGQEEIWLINEVGEEPWMGEIRVAKTVDDPRDEDPSLAGFEFSLYKVDGEDEDLVETLTTGNSGSIVFDGLEEGHYVLYETNLLWFYEGIDLDGEEIHLDEETAPNGYIQINVKNERYYPEDWMGEIRVVKTVDDPRDEDPSLAGFEFSLYKVDGEDEDLVETLTTGNSGAIVFDGLTEGHYILYETNLLWFYEGIDPDGEEIHLDEETAPNGYIQINVENERYYPEEWMGEIRVVKTVDDPRDSTPSLSGFTFELFMVDDEEETFVRRITTNSTGVIVFEDLEEGQYKLYEQNEPGYDEGISASGRLINLNPDSAPNGQITIDVENERVYPPPDDDVDDDDRPRPRPEPEEEEEEEVLEVVVIEEPIPEAPPVPEPIVEVVEEVIPLATLPKTGSYDPSSFGGIGVALLGLGLLLKKKEDK